MNILYFIPALRIVLGVLFILASSLKFPNMNGFADAVASYNIGPLRFVKLAAYVYVFIEFVVGWWILSGQYLLYGSYAGLLLIVVADLFLLKGYFQKKKVKDCGCYGVIKSPLTKRRLVENAVLTVLFVFLVIAARAGVKAGFI